MELIFFKFIPDIGTAFYQNGISTLTNFNVYSDFFLRPESVMYPRFLGNKILYETAILISSFYNSADLRLHPLRIAAGILTPLYFLIGLCPIFFDKQFNSEKFIFFYFINYALDLDNFS